MDDLADAAADRVKDAMLDVGCAAAEESPVAFPPLPDQLSPLAVFVNDELEQTLARVAEVVHEEFEDSWSPQTEKRVRLLLAKLSQAILVQALDLRILVTQEQPPGETLTPGGWAHKYRLMRAQEGHWPTAPGRAGEGETAGP
jgi:hypothetical protein